MRTQLLSRTELLLEFKHALHVGTVVGFGLFLRLDRAGVVFRLAVVTLVIIALVPSSLGG